MTASFGHQSDVQPSPGSGDGPGERTLIVACEFTGRKYRQRLTASARLAKGALRAVEAQARSSQAGIAESQDDLSEASTDTQPSAASELTPEAAECRELAESAGANVLDVIVQRRDHPDPATLVGKGKLEEIAAMAAALRADLI
ncbi:MAG: hypothetical protein ABI164_10400, partial [Acidobacteriaceae bacterium]